MKKAVLLLLVLLGSVGWVMGQHTVKGVVTSADGTPLPMVAVLLEGTTSGVATDMDGRYSIDVPSAESVLVFAYTGYETQKITVGNQHTINVELQEAMEEIDEVMVVAYGTVKKESFTGSADVISSKKLEKRPVTNVTKSLDGLTTGVMTTSGSGQPGEGAKVRIRGFGSFNASSDPLYVVDGIPYGGSISALNPADIESVSVLKDASAGALYGARGANGVIMITTKKGGKGAECENMRVNFKGSWGGSNRAIPRFKTLGTKEYFEYYYWAYRNAARRNGVLEPMTGAQAIEDMQTGAKKILGGSQKRVVRNGKVFKVMPGDDPNEEGVYDDVEFNPFDKPLKDVMNPETGEVSPEANLLWEQDWLDEATRKFPFRHEYSLSVSGGGPKTSYLVSFGALWDKGLMVNTNFNRYTGLVNVNTRPKDWFAAGLSANMALTSSNYSDYTDLTTGNVWYTCNIAGPVYPVYELDSAFQVKKDPLTGRSLFDYSGSRKHSADHNPTGNLYDDFSYRKNNEVSTRAYINLLDLPDGPLQGLKLAFNVGGDFSLRHFKDYRNRHTGDGKAVNGSIFDEIDKDLSYTVNQLLTYVRTFQDVWTVDVLVGHESYRLGRRYLAGDKNGFPLDDLFELSAASGNDKAYGNISEYAVESWLSRFNFNYAERYYLSASFRRDGSSRFAKESRWGNFWSIGANWRISQEAFMKDVDWVDNLSFKVSYGVQGNDDLQSFYPYQSVYAFSSWSLSGKPGALVDGVENRNLRWEKNANFNIGVEGRMWNRFNFSVEWYYRKVTDMLMYKALPFSTGFASMPYNIGAMRNHGLEVSLQADLIQLENGFRWGMMVTGSTISNKILQLDGRDEILGGTKIDKIGYPMGAYYLPKSAGVDPATGDRLYWAKMPDPQNPQDSIMGITADASLASKTREIVGSRIPDLYGTIATDLEYFGFDLSLLCTYSIGGVTHDGMYNDLVDNSSGYLGKAIHQEGKRAWKNPGDRTDIPRAVLVQENRVMTSDQLISASYFAFKNVSFGYTFPKEWMERIQCQNLRLSFVADNLWVFSHLPGMNPQATLLGGGGGYTYTPVRTFTFHLDLTF